MSRLFKTRTFSRWMRRTGLEDEALKAAVVEMEAGLVDADLGGCLLKKRVPLGNRGKRGGARTIVATRFSGSWFFVFGFGKNERASIEKDELRALQEVAVTLLALGDDELAEAVSVGELLEV